MERRQLRKTLVIGLIWAMLSGIAALSVQAAANPHGDSSTQVEPAPQPVMGILVPNDPSKGSAKGSSGATGGKHTNGGATITPREKVQVKQKIDNRATIQPRP